MRNAYPEAEWVGFDADGAINPSTVLQLIRTAVERNGMDRIGVRRNCSKTQVGARSGVHLLSHIFLFGRRLIGLRFVDTQCGIKNLFAYRPCFKLEGSVYF